MRAGGDRTRKVVAADLGQATLRYEHDPEGLAEADFYIVTAPTPIDNTRQPVQVVAEIVGYRGKLVFDAGRPDGPPRKLLDISKVAALGWSAKTSLREGLQAAYKDFLDRGTSVRER